MLASSFLLFSPDFGVLFPHITSKNITSPVLFISVCIDGMVYQIYHYFLLIVMSILQFIYIYCSPEFCAYNTILIINYIILFLLFFPDKQINLKNHPNSTNSSKMNSPKAAAPKKRGRPPKSKGIGSPKAKKAKSPVKPQSPSASAGNAAAAASGSKKGRGRPKGTGPPKSPKEKSGRGRGRPPKGSGTGKRGRPAKKAAAEQPGTSASEESSGEHSDAAQQNNQSPKSSPSKSP